MSTGWIKLHRQIQDCWIWDEDEAFDRRSAWIDLLLLANHDDHKTFIGGELVIVKRGQRLTSIRKLAERWRWGNEKTLKFLRALESEEMIERSTNAGRTLISIVNYEKFQGADEQSRTQTERQPNANRTRTEREPSTNKNIKNDKKDKNEKKDKNNTPLYPPLGEGRFSERIAEIIGEWLQYKMERNERYKPRGYASLLKMFEDNVAKYGEDAVVNVVQMSMGNRYQGIVWDSLQKGRRGSSAYMDAIHDRTLVAASFK